MTTDLDEAYNDGFERGKAITGVALNRKYKTQIADKDKAIEELREDLEDAYEEIDRLKGKLEAYQEFVLVDPYDD